MNPFIAHLEKQSKLDQEVLFAKGKSFSYSALLQESRILASHLRAQGMEAGQTAFIACTPGFEFLTIIYATILLKVKVALIDPEMGKELYEKKIKQLEPEWGFIDSRLLLLQEHPIARWFYKKFSSKNIYIPFSKNYKKVATGMRMPLLQRHLRMKPSGHVEPIELESSFEDYEYIITYTSGTTSSPKGVVHSITSVNESIELIVGLLQNNPGEVLATHLPHFMLIGICAGIKVHLWKEEWSAKKKIEFITQNEISILFGPPADYLQLMQYCKKSGTKIPQCIKHILIGSAPVHVPFLEELVEYVDQEVKISLTYGMTENLIAAVADGRQKIETSCKGDLLGKTVEGLQVKIAGDDEILLKSDQLFKRYLGHQRQDGFHATGDLGHVDPNGNLILTGRKKDMIIRGNFNIYPALYEPTIKKIPGIIEAVMIGKYSDQIADEKVYLFVESVANISVTKIIALLKKGEFSIDKEAIPDEVILGVIPRKGRQSKIDRALLRENIQHLSIEI